jgi:hypothetical protein
MYGGRGEFSGLKLGRLAGWQAGRYKGIKVGLRAGGRQHNLAQALAGYLFLRFLNVLSLSYIDVSLPIDPNETYNTNLTLYLSRKCSGW